MNLQGVPPQMIPQPVTGDLTPLQHDLLMRGIKIIDIGYIIVMYFLFGFACAMMLDSVLGRYDKEHAQTKSTTRLTCETLVIMWCIGVVTYLVRNLAEAIPFPLDGFHGFQHSRVKELGSAAFFTFILMFYSFNLRDRLYHLYERYTGTVPSPPLPLQRSTGQPSVKLPSTQPSLLNGHAQEAIQTPYNPDMSASLIYPPS